VHRLPGVGSTFRESDGWPVVTDIVDDDIRGRDRSGKRGDPIGVSDVDVVGDHAVDGADLHHEIRVEFGDVDLGTVSDEQLGRRSSNSRSATGDDGGATSEESVPVADPGDVVGGECSHGVTVLGDGWSRVVAGEHGDCHTPPAHSDMFRRQLITRLVPL
mgnify:CR=1